ALTGKLGEKSAVDDRITKLMKDYYSGRRDSITGVVLIPAGLLIMTIMIAAGLKPIAAFFIICWMFFWGAAALAGGLGKWIASRSEMNSLGYGSQSQIQGLPGNLFGPSGEQREIGASGSPMGPHGYRPSVTEQTTRQLDERRAGLPLEREHD